MTRISASVLFTPYSKLYILSELSANDVKCISSDRQELDLSKYILGEKSLAIYFEDSQFRRNRTFISILSNIYVDKRSRIR